MIRILGWDAEYETADTKKRKMKLAWVRMNVILGEMKWAKLWQDKRAPQIWAGWTALLFCASQNSERGIIESIESASLLSRVPEEFIQSGLEWAITNGMAESSGDSKNFSGDSKNFSGDSKKASNDLAGNFPTTSPEKIRPTYVRDETNETDDQHNGQTAIGADEQPAKIPKGAQTFIDLWNGHAEKSGLGKIKEWTTKRATRLKALATTYGKGMAEAMPLAVQECHKAAWAIQNRANVDHILVQDNFQRYLDKARTDAAAPPVTAAAPGEAQSPPKAQRNAPAWVADKIKEVEAKIAARKREKRKYEWEKREQSAKEMEQEIFELEIQLNALR